MSQTDLSEGEHAAGLDASDVAQKFDVDVAVGLSQAEAASRLQTHGANRLTASKTESGFEAFVRQYRDFMQIVLLAAAVINLVVTGDGAPPSCWPGSPLFNAVIGLRQEAKAEESVKALAQMMKTIARVRRDGQAIEVDAGDLVPGDVVLVEAGNRMPADGRICVAATLEIEEAALTGESLPVGKSIDPVPGDDVPLGDRTCMAYMNTAVTRGRGEVIVTATGMDTEIGHIADLLANTETDKTPLQKQLDGLSKIIAVIAGDRPGPGHPARTPTGRVVRHAVHHRCCPRGRGHPDRTARGRDGVALDGDTRDRPSQRDRQAAAGGRDAGLDVGDLLGQDRHPDPEQDDRPRDGDPRAEPVRGLRRGLRHRRGDQARRRVAHRPRPLPAADDPVCGRRARRRGPDRRPDRGRADRAGRQGRPGRRRDAGRPSRGSRRCRSTPSTSSWRPSTR